MTLALNLSQGTHSVYKFMQKKKFIEGLPFHMQTAELWFVSYLWVCFSSQARVSNKSTGGNFSTRLEEVLRGSKSSCASGWFSCWPVSMQDFLECVLFNWPITSHFPWGIERKGNQGREREKEGWEYCLLAAFHQFQFGLVFSPLPRHYPWRSCIRIICRHNNIP